MQVQEYKPVPTPVVTPSVPGPVAGPPPGQEREPKSKPGLGRIVLSTGAIAVGVLGVVDLAGGGIPVAAYIAVPLTVVGLGMVVGAWYGRPRGLIAVGIVLSLALGIAGLGERVSRADGSVTWRPKSIESVDRTYTADVGNAVLDLSAVDFNGRSATVQVDVGIGDLTIIVPDRVDVRAEAQVSVGNADVFGNHWGGIGQSTQTVVDDGTDGPGGGDLVIRATVDVGDVEVRR